jgi:hypothetical protein
MLQISNGENEPKDGDQTVPLPICNPIPTMTPTFTDFGIKLSRTSERPEIQRNINTHDDTKHCEEINVCAERSRREIHRCADFPLIKRCGKTERAINHQYHSWHYANRHASVIESVEMSIIILF